MLCRYEHPVKGQGIYAYVTLHEGTEYKDSLRKELIQTVREQIGAFAAPDVIHWAPGTARTPYLDLLKSYPSKQMQSTTLQTAGCTAAVCSGCYRQSANTLSSPCLY